MDDGESKLPEIIEFDIEYGMPQHAKIESEMMFPKLTADPLVTVQGFMDS